MKKLLVLGLICCATAGAVEPAYEGPLGNPEEPALRPIKWALSGIGGFFYQSGKAFRDGNMNTPIVGSAELVKGLGVGTIELGNSVANGIVYKPIMDHKEFKKQHKWNQKIDADLLLRNVRDEAGTVAVASPAPGGRLVEMENDEKVKIRLEEARRIREERAAAREARDPYKTLTRVERAQLLYVPERVEAGAKKKETYTGNLLKLGK